MCTATSHQAGCDQAAMPARRRRRGVARWPAIRVLLATWLGNIDGRTTDGGDRDSAAAHRRGGEKIRCLQGGGPAVARHQGRRVFRAAGPERLRQDHAVAHARRLRDAGRGPHPARRQGHRAGAAAPAPGQHDVPELRAVSPSHRARQHRVRAEARRHAGRRNRDAGGRTGGAGQARGPREAQARSALRRPEAARGAGALAGAAAAGAAARRAPGGTRQEAAREHASRIDGAAAAARHHLHHRHPRPGRGDDDGRPHRRDGWRPARTGRDPARALRGAGDRAGSPSSSATSISSRDRSSRARAAGS